MAITVEVGSPPLTVIKKSVVINSSQSWTVPANIAGNTVWVTGCGGGGSGGISTSGFVIGGFGGAFGKKIPYNATPSQIIPVVIGAGGLGVTGASAQTGNDGGNSSFGTLVFSGGSKGVAGVRTDLYSYKGISPVAMSGSNTATFSVFNFPDNIDGNRAGAIKTGTDMIAGGGACGLFGNGTDGLIDGHTSSAAANSGAGSGSVIRTSGTRSTGDGGSGRIVVGWEEFL